MLLVRVSPIIRCSILWFHIARGFWSHYCTRLVWLLSLTVDCINFEIVRSVKLVAANTQGSTLLICSFYAVIAPLYSRESQLVLRIRDR